MRRLVTSCFLKQLAYISARRQLRLALLLAQCSCHQALSLLLLGQLRVQLVKGVLIAAVHVDHRLAAHGGAHSSCLHGLDVRCNVVLNCLVVIKALWHQEGKLLALFNHFAEAAIVGEAEGPDFISAVQGHGSVSSAGPVQQVCHAAGRARPGAAVYGRAPCVRPSNGHWRLAVHPCARICSTDRPGRVLQAWYARSVAYRLHLQGINKAVWIVRRGNASSLAEFEEASFGLRTSPATGAVPRVAAGQLGCIGPCSCSERLSRR